MLFVLCHRQKLCNLLKVIVEEDRVFIGCIEGHSPVETRYLMGKVVPSVGRSVWKLQFCL